MPIYEYECAGGHRFERRQGFHDEPLRLCVECEQPARRLLSAPGIIFKGSGWYITDSRPAQSSGESGGGTTSGPTETKSEATAPKSDAPAASGDGAAKTSDSPPKKSETAA